MNMGNRTSSAQRPDRLAGSESSANFVTEVQRSAEWDKLILIKTPSCFALLFAKILFLAELTIIITAAHTTTVLTAVISSTERYVSFKYIFNNSKFLFIFHILDKIWAKSQFLSCFL